MDPQWLTLFATLIGASVGAFVGVKVAIASLKERVHILEVEVEKLRDAKHDHSNHITRHELQIAEIMIRVRDER